MHGGFLSGTSAIVLIALLLPCRARANPPGAGSGGTAEPAACSVPSAIAPEAARAIADEFFARGKLLREQGKIAEACACLDASDRVAPGRGGTLLTLGLCREHEGKLAAAYRELNRALAKARQDGRADREAMASEHLAAIEAKLAWLAIELPANAGSIGATVTLDGAPVERDDLARIAVEPGKHVLSISAEGFVTRGLEVTAARAGERQVIRVEPLERTREPGAAPAAPAPGVSPAAERSSPLPPPSRDDSRPRGNEATALRTVALVAGIAGVAVSLGAGAWALERKSVVHSECDDDKRCSERGVDAASAGRALVAVGTGAFVVGALGFGAWLLLPRETSIGATGERASGAVVSVRGVF